MEFPHIQRGSQTSPACKFNEAKESLLPQLAQTSHLPSPNMSQIFPILSRIKGESMFLVENKLSVFPALFCLYNANFNSIIKSSHVKVSAYLTFLIVQHWPVLCTVQTRHKPSIVLKIKTSKSMGIRYKYLSHTFFVFTL